VAIGNDGHWPFSGGTRAFGPRLSPPLREPDGSCHPAWTTRYRPTAPWSRAWVQGFVGAAPTADALISEDTGLALWPARQTIDVISGGAVPFAACFVP